MALFCLAWLIALSAFAATGNDDWVVRHYGSTQGMPVGSAVAARVDGAGFLWVATHDGLARFDGQQFSIHDTARVVGMSSNRIMALYRGDSGRVYALNDNDELLAMFGNRVERILPDPERPLASVRHIDPASLCVTLVSGLFCPDRDGRFRTRLRFDPQFDAAIAMPISALDTWLVIPGQGVHLQTGDQRRLILDRPGLALASGGATRALVDSSGALLIDLATELLWLRRDGSSQTLHRHGPESSMTVLQLRQDPQQRHWIDTSSGIHVLGKDGLQLHRPASSDPNLARMRSWQAPDEALWESDDGRLYRDGRLVLESQGLIEHISFDVEHIVWVSTLRDGLYSLTHPRVEQVGRSQGIENDNLVGMDHAQDGSIWSASLGGGVIRIDRDRAIRSYGPDQGLPGLYAWAVASAADGSILVAPFASGLYRLAPDQERFQAVALPPPLASARIIAITFDDEGRLWLGSEAGAWMQDGAYWRKAWPVRVSLTVSSILFGDDASVWYGSENGLWRQDPHGTSAVAQQLLNGVRVRHLLRSRDGAVWASTEGHGLVRIAPDDPYGHHAQVLGRAHGLPSNSPHAVHEDGDGHLWVNSNQGIFRLLAESLDDFIAGHVSALSPLVLGPTDGLSDLEGNGGAQPGAAVDGAGAVWFPTQRGAIRIDPARIRLRSHPPLPVIEDIEAAGLTRYQPGTPTLPLGSRSIVIRYNAADLLAGEALRFRYRLLPIDPHWTDAGNRRVASFAALAPGNYRFEVLAANGDGIWSQKPSSQPFSVPAYWYETGWFRLGLLLATIVFVAYAVHRRTLRLRQRAFDLDTLVAHRTRELRDEKHRAETTLAQLANANASLASQNLQIERSNRKLADQSSRLEDLDRFRARLLADVSHELRTPLMLISMPIKDLHAQSTGLNESERRRLELSLKQAERLSRLVEQLVDLVQAEAGQLRLNISALDLGRFLEELRASYEPAGHANRIALVLAGPAESQTVFADPAKLTTILGNLIDNAFKYTPAGHVVRIAWRLVADGDRVRIEVHDQGPGFDRDRADQMFKRFYRGDQPTRPGRRSLGIGLALARELVDLHGGRIGARSKPGEGACFWIELPLGRAHISADELVLTEATSLAVIAAKAAPRASSPGAGRVLLVEDHPQLANYLGTRLLEYLQVDVVDSAEAGLELLARKPFDLVISDVLLPGMSGVELCRKLKSNPQWAGLPVLLISAKASASDREFGLASGAADFLSKPFSFEHLMAAIARAWPDAQALIDSHDIKDSGHVDPVLAPALAALADPDFDIGRWASQCHVSERQLRRRVHDLTGQGPIVWLREQRLQLVRRLISSGECRTLAEAGAHAGIDNPGYLYRLYRARFGETDAGA